jgi:hypothetical protein
MINEIRRFGKLLGPEKDFTVVYRDQRGCGRSFRGHKGEAALTLDLMVNDTVSLLELLGDRFDTNRRGYGLWCSCFPSRWRWCCCRSVSGRQVPCRLRKSR